MVPVAGDTDHPIQIALPTLDRLGTSLSDDVDAKAIATRWFSSFMQRVDAADASGIAELMLEDAMWRDILALTWEFRTFVGSKKIHIFLSDVLGDVHLSNLVLQPEQVELLKPYPDLAWIQGVFKFETKVGLGNGVFRLVLTSSGGWKAHVVSTELVGLKGHPERIGPLRDHETNHGTWPEKRHREIEFADHQPVVVIIGGGQNGLEVAARLKMLNVPTLIVEKQSRVGDQWRTRYEALCLHDPVWYDHFAYMPFPPSWPVWTPAPKLADWLEFYAHTLELNVWTNATITKITQDETTKGWIVDVIREDGSHRQLKPRHIVFAHGIGGGVPKIPKIPGMGEFQGQIRHSTQHKSARENIGKKVVVIGSGTSGHDICMDHVMHGVDVTMYQRSPTYVMSVKEGMPRLFEGRYWEGTPPTEQVDRIDVSYPNLMGKLLGIRTTKAIAEADREMLEGLRKRGFKLTFGDMDSGVAPLWLTRGGGYYFDVGASKAIAEGRIKLVNSSPVARINSYAVVLENGIEIPADIVILATGFGNPRDLVRKLAGDAIADKIGPVWGLNEEGEMNSVWRWCGVQGLYFMLGNLAMSRVYSQHLALQIKAQEEGLYGNRYTA